MKKKFLMKSSKDEKKLLNKKRKANSIDIDSTWSYNKILSEEKKIRKKKKIRK